MFRLIKLLLLIALGALAAAFAMGNMELVPLNLFFVQLEEAYVGYIALAAFAAGGLFGLLASSLVWFRLKRAEVSVKRKLVQSENKLAQSEKELDGLRSNIG